MEKLFLLLTDAADPRLGGADSYTDRLSCRHTVALLSVFAALITTRQIVGEPISCWCPVHFSNSNVDYANKGQYLRYPIMDRLVWLLKDSTDPRVGGGDGFAEQLSCVYTVSILILFSVLLTTRQYVGEPISCWCPQHFSSSNVDYTNKVCWTTSTYFLPWEVQNIPAEDDPRRKVSYYQWVSILLVFQAVLFYIPRAIWRACNRKSGIAVHTITDAAIERQKKNDPEAADKVMMYMVKHMSRFLVESSRGASQVVQWRRVWMAFYGNYLLTAYLIVKLIYLGNIIGQIALINAFLGTNYHMYGWDVLKRFANGENWATSDRFPRVTLCDFKLRIVGNINRYTVQCTLPMNLLNEIFFIFLWFWFLFVGVATVMSFLAWLNSSVSYQKQISFIKHRLVAMDKFYTIRGGKFVSKIDLQMSVNQAEAAEASSSSSGDDVDHENNVTTELNNEENFDVTLDDFVKNYLRRDGCFILRLVGKNASEHIAAELIAGLWEYYKDYQRSNFYRTKPIKVQPT